MYHLPTSSNVSFSRSPNCDGTPPIKSLFPVKNRSCNHEKIIKINDTNIAFKLSDNHSLPKDIDSMFANTPSSVGIDPVSILFPER